jgi:Pyruvate/2-oxoacid:ferredoxin oxidoreductase gamma subunit
VVRVPLEKLVVEKLGMTKAANVIMIGAYLNHQALVRIDKMKKSIREKFRDASDYVLKMNFKALELGYSI